MKLTEKSLAELGFKIDRPLGDDAFNTNAYLGQLRLIKNTSHGWVPVPKGMKFSWGHNHLDTVQELLSFITDKLYHENNIPNN